MKKYLMVEADTNDTDCVRSFKPVTDKQLNSFMPLIEAIKAFKPYEAEVESSFMKGEKSKWTHAHNFPNNDYRDDLGEKSASEIYKGVVSKRVFEEFDCEFVPSFEHGVHTITEIKLVEVASITDLFG